ncbi:hypothetical protein PENSPDRAFT_754231 [Peniophora sp. CONT]|nr:hypothetical protein PENSPDRAFT_754231 [Peniophora sp. CONT]
MSQRLGSRDAVPTDPRSVLSDLARHATSLKAIVTELPPASLDGPERKEHILDAIEKVSHPLPAKLKIPISSDVLSPSPLPRTSIGIIGSTGLGKSTLLSSVLGRDILPASSVGRGTAAPTIITYHPDDHIEASLTFMPLEEFRGAVESTMDLLEPDENGRILLNSELMEDPSYAMISESLSLSRKDLMRIKKGSNGAHEDGQQASVNAVLQMYPELTALLGSTISIRETNEKSFRDALEQYMGPTRDRKGLKKWAFLTLFVIKYNAEVVSDGSILIDLPGSDDCSAIVTRAIERFKERLDVKLVAVLSPRASTEAIVNEHMVEEIKRRRRTHMEQLEEEGEEGAGPDTLDKHRVANVFQANSTGLAVISEFISIPHPKLMPHSNLLKVTQCDALTRDDETQRLEEDRDVKRLLQGDAEYQKLVEECVRTQAEYDAKSAILQSLDDEGIRGLKRLKLSNEAQAAARDGNDSEHSELAQAASDRRVERQEAEREMKRARKSYQQSMERRRVMVTRARYLASGVNVRRSFRDCVIDANQDVDHGSEDSDAEEDGEDLSLPVFATSAQDFNWAVTSGNSELESTGVPALRKFLRHLGARAEYQAALDLLRPFRAEVESTHLLVTASDSETIGEKVARQKQDLRNRWASRDLRSLRSSTNSATTNGIRLSLEAAFAKKVKERLGKARADLQVLETTCEEGAQAASNAARPTAQSLMEPKKHWGIYRAVMRRHGHYGDLPDFNITLVDHLFQAIETAVDDYCGWEILDRLQADLTKVASALFHNVRVSAIGYDENLNRQLRQATARSQENVQRSLDKMKREGSAIFQENRHLSTRTFLGSEVQSHLEDVYDEAFGYRGNGFLKKMKAYFVEAVWEAGETMFDDITREFVDYQSAILNEVEALIKTTCTQIAKECEMEISNAWVVPAKERKLIRTRTKAATSVQSIAQSLSLLETKLVEEMRRSENSVPTCHPAP